MSELAEYDKAIVEAAEDEFDHPSSADAEARLYQAVKAKRRALWPQCEGWPHKPVRTDL